MLNAAKVKRYTSQLRDITCHTVLPATRHKWTRPAYPSQKGWYSINL